MSDDRSTGSVTRWLQDLNGSENAKSQAQQQLWDRYFSRLASLARSRLPMNVRAISDDEDVALSALDSFFRRVDKDEFPDLDDRTGLWPLLAQITIFKAIKRIEKEHAQKRGGPASSKLDDSQPLNLEEVISNKPTPEMVALMHEQTEVMLGKLDAPLIRQIAELKLQGYKNDEIAERLVIGRRSVERKLKHIRTVWAESAPTD